MKSPKNPKKPLPEVHILGDLDDVKKLVSAVNKKKAIVIFRNPEENTIFLEIDKKFKQIHGDDLPLLEKAYKVVYFSFFPSLKKTVSPDTGSVENGSKTKPARKEKRVKRAKKEKKEKKGKAGKKARVEN